MRFAETTSLWRGFMTYGSYSSLLYAGQKEIVCLITTIDFHHLSWILRFLRRFFEMVHAFLSIYWYLIYFFYFSNLFSFNVPNFRIFIYFSYFPTNPIIFSKTTHSQENFTSIHLAAMHSREDVVKFLLKQTGIDLYSTGGVSILEKSNIEFANYLLHVAQKCS